MDVHAEFSILTENNTFTTHVKGNLSTEEVVDLFKALNEALAENKPFTAAIGQQCLWLPAQLLRTCVVSIKLPPDTVKE